MIGAKDAHHQIGGIYRVVRFLNLARDGIGFQMLVLASRTGAVLRPLCCGCRIHHDYNDSDMIPINGMRTQAGRVFSSYSSS